MHMTGYLAALRSYARFEGRATRGEFWSFLLGAGLVCLFAASVEAQLLRGPGHHEPVVVWFVALAHIVPAYAVSARRLHDTNRTGWLVLLNVIPLGTLVVLALACLPGTLGPNRYGPDPLGREPLPEAPSVHRTPAAGVIVPTASFVPARRDAVGEIERLAQLRASGALSETEFAAMKARLLGQGGLP